MEGEVREVMDALKFLEEKNRMCDEHPACVGCPLGELAYCADAEPEEVVKVVEKWSKEHPFVTNGMKISELLPYSKDIDIDKGKHCVTIYISNCWWDAEYKEE